MTHCRLKMWRCGARIVVWIVAIAALLGSIASCSSVNRFFGASPDNELPIQGAQNQKRVPLPPLIEDYE